MGAPNQLGTDPGTDLSIHKPSFKLKYFSSHSKPEQR